MVFGLLFCVSKRDEFRKQFEELLVNDGEGGVRKLTTEEIDRLVEKALVMRSAKQKRWKMVVAGTAVAVAGAIGLISMDRAQAVGLEVNETSFASKEVVDELVEDTTLETDVKERVVGENSPEVTTEEKPTKQLTVVLDAGHGGEDPGALGADGQREADHNLRLVQSVGERLEEMGVNVRFTRTGDYFVSIQERVDIAQMYKDLYGHIIKHSIHRNSDDAHGVGIIYGNPDITHWSDGINERAPRPEHEREFAEVSIQPLLEIWSQTFVNDGLAREGVDTFHPQLGLFSRQGLGEEICEESGERVPVPEGFNSWLVGIWEVGGMNEGDTRFLFANWDSVVDALAYGIYNSLAFHKEMLMVASPEVPETKEMEGQLAK